MLGCFDEYIGNKKVTGDRRRHRSNERRGSRHVGNKAVTGGQRRQSSNERQDSRHVGTRQSQEGRGDTKATRGKIPDT